MCAGLNSHLNFILKQFELLLKSSWQLEHVCTDKHYPLNFLGQIYGVQSKSLNLKNGHYHMLTWPQNVGIPILRTLVLQFF